MHGRSAHERLFLLDLEAGTFVERYLSCESRVREEAVLDASCSTARRSIPLG